MLMVMARLLRSGVTAASCQMLFLSDVSIGRALVTVQLKRRSLQLFNRLNHKGRFIQETCVEQHFSALLERFYFGSSIRVHRVTFPFINLLGRMSKIRYLSSQRVYLFELKRVVRQLVSQPSCTIEFGFAIQEEAMNLSRSISNCVKAAAVAGLLFTAAQPTFAYHLRGAICKRGGSPAITLENQDGKFILQLSTGVDGKSQVGLVIKGLENNPIIVKDLDLKSPITAVFEIRDKTILKYSRTLQAKISVRNADGKIITPVVGYDTDVNRAGRIPLRKVSGTTYSATIPSKVITELGAEVPRLKIGENSPVVGCVIYLDGENFGFDEKNKFVQVDSISVAGTKLGVQDLGNFLGCDAFPSSAIPQ